MRAELSGLGLCALMHCSSGGGGGGARAPSQQQSVRTATLDGSAHVCQRARPSHAATQTAGAHTSHCFVAAANPKPDATGTLLGGLFTIISLKLTLGTAGIIPSLNIPGGLISFAAIKSLTAAGARMRLSQRAPLVHGLLFQPFGLQENAVLQTYILSMGAGGFGTYLTGMGYQAYRNLGGAPRGSPDFNQAVVYDPIPSNTMPYHLLTSVMGAFMLTQLRKLMIIDWRLPFPSGTASGIMLNSFHTAVGGPAAAGAALSSQP